MVEHGLGLLNRGDGTFEARREYATGRTPHAVAIGDLTGDGKLDLAAANYDAGTVSVLENAGDGSFHVRRDYPVGRLPVSSAIGDLNRDGIQDLAVANALDDTLSVFLNPGGGSFGPRQDYATGLSPQDVVIGDLNGDGKPDLAAPNYYPRAFRLPSTLSVFVGRGDGRFENRVDSSTEVYPRALALGDLNGDGKPDLVTTSANNIVVLLNTTRFCTVPEVVRRTLQAAKRRLAHAGCRLGRIRRSYSRSVKRGRVISQAPKAGSLLTNHGGVKLVVSRGRR